MEASPTKYAIIIDSGSSGSRALVYEFSVDSNVNPTGLPKIKQVGNMKTKPGLSTFGKKKVSSYNLWDDHFADLIENARRIIPLNLHSSTPIFVQATAGMRLLPTNERDRVLKETCEVLSDKTDFIVKPCESHIEVIDGDTEGLYGWLGLNYLTNRLQADSNKHPYGFMDMGGASTQLAFVPSRADQLDRHSDDMYTVNLRSNDGNLNQWSVFVSSWLGFGANEARKRQLGALVNALPENVNYDKDGDGKGDLVDPCSPVGMKTDVEYNNKIFTVTGSGEYEGCLKTIYPLLLKHLPCSDEPCLFNGVHAPAMDFSLEKFVGVSEYWYTANDVFKLTGEYNYEAFERATKEFCATDWNTIYERFENHEFGDALTLELLQTSCFKASWIVNILHEGFDIPRLGVDNLSELNVKDEPIFKSVNNIDGNELSWTLGKMVMYASSQTDGDGVVGIVPGSSIKNKIDSVVNNKEYTEDIADNISSNSELFFPYGIILALGCILYYIILRKFGSLKAFMKRFHDSDKVESMEELIDLEEGRSLSHRTSSNNLGGTLRTRSTLNLHELEPVNPNGGGDNSSLNNFSVPPPSPYEGLKHSFTFTSFRDPTLTSGKHNNKFSPSGFGFKFGNGSQQSLKS